MKLNKDYFERREISDFVRIIEDLERRINNPSKKKKKNCRT